MKTTEEKMYLECVLKQMDLEKPCFHCSRIAGMMLWVVIAAVVFFLFRMGHDLPIWAILAVSLFVGAIAGSYVLFRMVNSQWPFLRPHVSRESLEARIAELERQGF